MNQTMFQSSYISQSGGSVRKFFKVKIERKEGRKGAESKINKRKWKEMYVFR